MKRTGANNAAIIIATAGTLLETFIALFLSKNIPVLVLTALLIFASLYALSFFIIQRYINDRLKTVYRILHDKKSTPSSISITQASNDAESWETERSDEMERLRNNDVYRKEFVANVTHELKTPLFNIQGYVHSLLDGALEDREVNRMFLEKASRNVDRLATLVADLETITQLETGGAIFEPEVFDINGLVVDVFEALETKAQLRKRTLTFDNNRPTYVYADKEKIRQVFVNLIENSIKYGNENGNTTVNLIDADENALVEIADDGPGIANEHLNRLFERFYRVDRSRSREAGGTGLGLAIVKHIIEGHGKTINVQSEVGNGTTFRFALEKR